MLEKSFPWMKLRDTISFDYLIMDVCLLKCVRAESQQKVMVTPGKRSSPLLVRGNE